MCNSAECRPDLDSETNWLGSSNVLRCLSTFKVSVSLLKGSFYDFFLFATAMQKMDCLGLNEVVHKVQFCLHAIQGCV